MSNDGEDQTFDELVRRSRVAKGYRPDTDADVEAMLDALGNQGIPESKLARMLRKVRGEEPMGWEVCAAPQTPGEATDQSRELVEMFRSEGDDNSPELEEMLRELEREAAQEAADNEDENVE